MRGVGDRITPVKLPPMAMLSFIHDLVLSTKDVYDDLRIVLTKGENEVKFSETIFECS